MLFVIFVNYKSDNAFSKIKLNFIISQQNTNKFNHY